MVCLICFLMVLSRRVRMFRISKTHWKMNLSKTNMLWHKGTKWTMCEWIYLNRPLVLQWVPTPPANIQQAETSFVTVQSAILLCTMRVGVAHLNRAQSTSLISPPPNPLSPRQKTFHNLKVTSFLLRGIHASCSHPPCLWWDAVFPMRLFLPSQWTSFNTLLTSFIMFNLPVLITVFKVLNSASNHILWILFAVFTTERQAS